MFKKKTKWAIGFGVTCFIVIGIWWWKWQEPYRVLSAFLKALQQGDIDTVYTLSLDKEKELGLTQDIVKSIYYQCLKPALTHHRLIKIERQNKNLLICEASITFRLWFEGLNRPILVGVTQWPGTRKWRISFSSFTIGITRFFLVKDDYQCYRLFRNLGLKFRVSPQGPIEDIEILILQSNPKLHHFEYSRK